MSPYIYKHIERCQEDGFVSDPLAENIYRLNLVKNQTSDMVHGNLGILDLSDLDWYICMGKARSVIVKSSVVQYMHHWNVGLVNIDDHYWLVYRETINACVLSLCY